MAPPREQDQAEAGGRPAWILAVIVGFIGVCLGPALVGSRTLLSVNALTGYPPWQTGGTATTGHELCTGDTIDAVLPGTAHVRSQVFAGHLASWQGLVSGGGPLSSVPNLGLLDPLSLPYWILPLWLAPAFVALLVLVTSIGGTYLFLRRLALSRSASLLAGFIFATSGFLVVWSNWPQTRVAALVPLLMWAMDRLIAGRRPRDAVLLAGVLASMLFGGFPEVTGFAVYLALAWLVVRLVLMREEGIARLGRVVALAAGGLVLGVAVTAVQLLPFLRFYSSANLDYRTGESAHVLPWSSLATLIVPNANGLCIGGKALHGSITPIETVAYLGAAALVLAVAGTVMGGRRGRQWRPFGPVGFFAGAAIVVAALGWTASAVRDLVAHLPIFSGNPIGRIRVIQGLCLAALAGFGFEWATTARRPPDALRGGRTVRPARVVGVVGGFVVLATLIAVRAVYSAKNGGYGGAFLRASWVPLLLLVVSGVVIGASRWPRQPRLRLAAFVVLPVLVAAQAGQFFHTVLPGDSRSNFYPHTATSRFLAAHLGPDRYASANNTLYPATSLYYGLRTPTGHAFTEPAWQDLLDRVDPTTMATGTFSEFTRLSAADVSDQPILDRMAVRYWVSPPGDVTGKEFPFPPLDGNQRVGRGTATCTLLPGSIRALTVVLTRPLVPVDPTRGDMVTVALSAGDHQLSSSRFLSARAPVGPLSVAVPGEDLTVADGPITATIHQTGAKDLQLATTGGLTACRAMRPDGDGLRLVQTTPGALIYQRMTALPRIRWADGTEVIRAKKARLSALAAGVPGNEVVLDRPGPPATGQPASVKVVRDGDDEISASVDAGGDGYLVVADALQTDGWSATVDGHAAALRPADDAMVAVAVPAGRHTIVLRYHAPGQLTGAVISLLAVLIGAVVVVVDRRRPLWAKLRPRVRARRSAGGGDTNPVRQRTSGAGRASHRKPRRGRRGARR